MFTSIVSGSLYMPAPINCSFSDPCRVSGFDHVHVVFCLSCLVDSVVFMSPVPACLCFRLKSQNPPVACSWSFSDFHRYIVWTFEHCFLSVIVFAMCISEFTPALKYKQWSSNIWLKFHMCRLYSILLIVIKVDSHVSAAMVWNQRRYSGYLRLASSLFPLSAMLKLL